MRVLSVNNLPHPDLLPVLKGGYYLPPRCMDVAGLDLQVEVELSKLEATGGPMGHMWLATPDLCQEKTAPQHPLQVGKGHLVPVQFKWFLQQQVQVGVQIEK